MAVVALHIGLALHFDPLDVIFSIHAIQTGDFSTHFAQTLRVIEGLEGWGKSWVYDVKLLAGHPHGVIFDADNKGWELWAFVMVRLGLPKGAAFNTFLLLAHALVLPAVYFSARLFDLGRWPALLAMALGSALWFFDSLVHYCWFGGMVAYVMASYLCLVPLALFYRFVHDRRWWQVLLCGVIAGVTHLVHPYAFFIMLVPVAVLYVQAFRSLSRAEHAAVLAIAPIVIGINAYWLLIALQFWHYIMDSGFGGQSTLAFLPADFLGLFLDHMVTGLIGNRTGFRFLCLGAALVTLAMWGKSRDARFPMFAGGIAALLLLAYAGGYSKIVAQIQPYRHIAACAYLSLVPAAALGSAVCRHSAFHQLPRLAYAVLAVLLLPGLQHLARDALYFFPDGLSKAAHSFTNREERLSPAGYPRHSEYRHTPWHRTHELAARWVRAHNDGKGRFLVLPAVEGEQLPWQTGAEILGGFPFRNLQHARANLFYHEFRWDISEDELRSYLETYAVKWIMVDIPTPEFDRMRKLLKLSAKYGNYRVYKTMVTIDLFQEGSGKAKARTNRIHVSKTDPDRQLVLRYHWLETLVCEPDCSIERAEIRTPAVDMQDVGFIRIPAPHPPDFVIKNAY